MKTSIFQLALAGVLPLAAATTFQELKDEVAAAADGATVYVENDMEVTGVLPCPGRVTITSPDGQTNTLRRAASYTDKFLNITDAASQLTLRDVVVDWNKAVGAATRFANVSAGILTLDAGAEVRDCRLGNGTSGGIYLTGSGRLVMNEGSVIRGFEGNSYGTAVLIGNNATGAVFEMNGGLITDCVDHYGATTDYKGYGGAVYVYGGDFFLHGGTITGNRSDNNVAGVVSWSGRWHLSGSAFVTNNVGAVANDAWVQSGYIHFDGDYEGRMTMRGLYEGMPDSKDGSQWAAYTGSYFGTGNVSSQRNPERIIHRFGDWGDRMASVGPGRYDTTNLTDAFDHARDGETVMVTQAYVTTDDWIFDGTSYKGLKDVVITGRPDGTTTLVRDHLSKPLFRISGGRIRFENIVLDGRCTEEVATYPLLLAGSDGHLELGPGCVVQNAARVDQTAAISVGGSGATLLMEDGAIIRDCRTTGEESWASAIRVGYKDDELEVRPRFEMRGGLITNCFCASKGSAYGAYGGAVYIQRADFVMSGGAIVGNRSADDGLAAAGLIVYDTGTATFSGTARIENNFGGANDVYRAQGCGTFRMVGDFRGRIGISSGEQNYDRQAGVVCEAVSTGAWNFFSAGTEPYGKYVGYNWSSEYFSGANDQIYWGTAVGTIDDAGFSNYERFNMAKYLPSTFDLDTESPLPHVLGGTALNLGGTVALTTADAETLKARLPLPLVQSVDGSALTGTWTFTVPAETGTGIGKWIVRTQRSSAGVTGYVLDWSKSGVVVTIR